MNRFWKGGVCAVAFIALLITGMGWVATAHANPYIPFQGGTGTSTAPIAGQTLIGNASGTYNPSYITCGTGCSIATSSGGISITATGSGGGSVNGPSTSTYVSVFTASSSVLGYASFTYNAASNILTITGLITTQNVNVTGTATTAAILNTGLLSTNTLNVTSTAKTNGISNTGNVTSTSESVTSITNALVTTNASGSLGAYGATSCSAGLAFTGFSASGTPTCTSYAPSTTIPTAASLAGPGLGVSGTTLTPSATYASSSFAFTIQNATTTPGFNEGRIGVSGGYKLTSLSCFTSNGTTTENLFRQDNLIQSTSTVDFVSSLVCGVAGNTTSSFTSSSIPAGAWITATTTAVSGNPSTTFIFGYLTKI